MWPQTPLIFLQKFANDFLWRGQNKVNTKTVQNPPNLGGLNQINVKHFMYNLRTKWMIRLWQDYRNTWSVFEWSDIVNIFPPVILARIIYGMENLLAKLGLFYARVICLFAYVNSLNLESNIQ